MNTNKIFVWSWNCESVRICESMDDEKIIFNRTSSLSMWYEGKKPDFWDSIKEKITSNGFHICIFCLQESAFPGCYMSSHFLPEEMDRIGYKLLNRSKLMGLGITSLKALINSGTFLLRGLRTSIYVKNNYYDLIKASTDSYVSKLGFSVNTYLCDNILIRNKGALAIYFSIPGIGSFTIINCHLPFDSQSLIESKINCNPMLRQNAVNALNTCFNNVVENLVFNIPTRPDYIILCGDLNYRVKNYDPEKMITDLRSGDLTYYDVYTTMDELYDQMRIKNIIYKFNEGVDGKGVSFMPTCKLINDGDSDHESFKYGKYGQRCPSYTDRILVQSSRIDHPDLKVLEYNRFSEGKTMSYSDHSSIYAVLQVDSCK